MRPSGQMWRGSAPPALLPLLLLALPATLQAAPPAETLAAAPPPPPTAQAQPSPADLSAWPGRGHPRSRGLLAEQQQAKRAAPMEIPPTHYPATRASGVVGNYINYQHGGPHTIFEVRQVSQASREDIAGVGHKYRLKFSIAEVLPKDSPVNCTAEILYHHGDQHVAPEVHYTVEGEFGKNTEQVDNEFYNRIKNLSELLEAQNIPDSHGNITAELEPVRNLARVACGYVIWQNSTEDTYYNMVQVESVKQVKRNDDYLEFSYVALIHDIVSQEIIPWHMQVLWHPQHGVKVIRNSRQPKRAAQD
ncbi:PREDICTED: latexin isoform X2 [Gekko japonicus]|uniref:Latexin isoform X2 n=1 Tax=Gekko japonicus TaxID=146911 RepID=A0ABM1KMM7_GEKJA|nr:PREDICTED: latexin isoform X2 [Gekko japonicus]